ncbi:MAG: rhodanese-like domain-containing protein [Acidobacteria bacterium]|nr:rhodanese-like domain-containing protein [Acidobacteriota bacterium]MBV9475649.1 rhodanese-like domain-containing protein [Acidobacteriota bacterium]
MNRTLAIAALVLGALAAIGGSPYRAQHANVDAARLARAIAHEDDHVTALELAEWIRDRKPRLRIIDLRSEREFATYHLPRAERVPIEAIPSTPFARDETLVLISDGGAHAAQAWVLLQSLGYRDVYFLRGGLGEWLDDVMSPAKPSDLTRYFGGVPRATGDEAAYGGGTSAAVKAMRRRGC